MGILTIIVKVEDIAILQATGVPIDKR